MQNDNSVSNLPSGVVLIDKPAGITSFGALARVRRRISEELGHKIKVGHAGTLDPFATGLLILLVGKATRDAMLYSKMDKNYSATMQLYASSSTGDPEGDIIEHSANYIPSIEQVSNALDHIVGKSTQIPPQYSAIKIHGQPAYKYARAGKVVDIPPRPITVYDCTLDDYAFPFVSFSISVSSGTYIRTIVEDLGKSLSIPAYTSSLRRNSAWNDSICCNISDATPLDKWLALADPLSTLRQYQDFIKK